MGECHEQGWEDPKKGEKPHPHRDWLTLCFIHYALYIFRYLYRPDLLAHKKQITDPKRDEGDRYDGNQMRYDDDDALEEIQGILKPGQGQPFQRTHQDQGLGRFPGRVQDDIRSVAV